MVHAIGHSRASANRPLVAALVGALVGEVVLTPSLGMSGALVVGAYCRALVMLLSGWLGCSGQSDGAD